MADQVINIAIKATDDFSKGLKGAGDRAQQFGQKLQNIGRQAGLAFVGISATIFKLSKSFGDFEAGMTNVAT